MIKDGQFKHELELRETIMWWIEEYLSVDGEAADWVLEPKRSIKKANRTFTTKFWWLLVRHYLSPPLLLIILSPGIVKCFWLP